MRLQIEPRSPSQRLVRPTSCVRAAAGLGLAAGLGVVALLSPALQVREVVWAGSLRPEPARMAALEAAAVGRPLLLGCDVDWRHHLQLAAEDVQIHFERHLPGTLEIIVNPLLATMVLDDDVLLDRQGNVLVGARAVPGLPRLRGFDLAAGRGKLDPESSRQCVQLLDGMARAGLPFASVERRGDELVVGLAQSQVQLLLSARELDAGLRKLQMLLCRFDATTLPLRIDLRFRGQIVLDSREARRGRG